MKRAGSLGFVHRPLGETLATEPLELILRRAESTAGEPAKSPVVDAVTATGARPDDKISEALNPYVSEIVLRDAVEHALDTLSRDWPGDECIAPRGLISLQVQGQSTPYA